jgi:hypothetical protein
MWRQHACLCSTLPVAFCPISAHHRLRTAEQVRCAVAEQVPAAVDAEVLRRHASWSQLLPLCGDTLLLPSAPARVGIAFVTKRPQSHIVCISQFRRHARPICRVPQVAFWSLLPEVASIGFDWTTIPCSFLLFASSSCSSICACQLVRDAANASSLARHGKRGLTTMQSPAAKVGNLPLPPMTAVPLVVAVTSPLQKQGFYRRWTSHTFVALAVSDHHRPLDQAGGLGRNRQISTP